MSTRLEKKPLAGFPDIMMIGKAPRKKKRKKKPATALTAEETRALYTPRPKRKRVKQHSRREIAGMVVEDQIDLFKKLSDEIFNVPPGTDLHKISKSGLYNTWLACGESLWKKMGLDAAMISEEARKSALEIVGELWEGGKHICSKCGHEDRGKG